MMFENVPAAGEPRRRHAAPPRATPVAMAVAIALFGIGHAHAQDAAAAKSSGNGDKRDGQGMQSVVVSGVRASQQQSLTAKRNADSFIEVITAEDVGKMPDKNVADSLQRVAGVNVAAASGFEGGFGENDRVAMRGTPSILTLTTINGHSVSGGDWFNNNINFGGRSASFALYPSAMIGRVVVHKTSQADILEGGTAGTVDIQTRKPLDFPKPLTVFLSADGMYSTAAKRTDPQVTAMLNWRNEQKTFGVLAQVFDEKRHINRYGQEMLWWDKVSESTAKEWVAAHPELAGKYVSLLNGTSRFEQVRERIGGTIDLQYKPTRDIMLDLTGLYSKLKADNSNSNFIEDPADSLGRGVMPSSWTVTRDTITALAFPSTCPANTDCSRAAGTVNQMVSRRGDYASSSFVNLDGEWRATDTLSLKGKLGTTKGISYAPDGAYSVESVYGGHGYQMNGTGTPANLWADNAGTFNPRSLGGWAFAAHAIDKENYGQVDARYKTGWDYVPMLSFGARTGNKTRVSLGSSTIQDPQIFSPSHIPGTPVTQAPSPWSQTINGNWTFTPGDLANWVANNIQYVTSYDGQFEIREKTKAAYLMGDLSFGRVEGNIGVRYVSTKEMVSNRSTSATVWDPMITTSTYNYFLPSLNLHTELAKDLLLRAAATRTMGRADIGMLARLDLNDITLTGNGGNPYLKPILSNNLDLGLEWYFEPKSLLSAALYKMNIGSYVTFGSSTGDFYNRLRQQTTTYVMSSAVNTKAQVQGFEVQYIQDLGHGFGVNTNYTYADGKETGKVANTACAMENACDMMGTSKNSYNVSLFYEAAKWNARVNYNYRSTFLNGLSRDTARYVGGMGTVSLAVGYNVDDRLSLEFSAKDLNDPLLVTWVGSRDRPESFYKNGRQFYLGARYKL